MKDLLSNLVKNKPKRIHQDEILDIIEDILRYFDSKEEEEYETNQYIIGMRYLFRGYAVKSWKGINFAYNNYTKLNKILIKHCIYYYKKY